MSEYFSIFDEVFPSIISDNILNRCGIFRYIRDMKCLQCGGKIIEITSEMEGDNDFGVFSWMCDNSELLPCVCMKCRLNYYLCSKCLTHKVGSKFWKKHTESSILDHKVVLGNGPISYCKFMGYDFEDDTSVSVRPNISLELINKIKENGNFVTSLSNEVTPLGNFVTPLGKFVPFSDFVTKWGTHGIKEVVDEIESFLEDGREIEYIKQGKIEYSEQPIYFYRGDKNEFYVDTEDITLTGPDGGFCHWWKCQECKKVIEVSDK